MKNDILTMLAPIITNIGIVAIALLALWSLLIKGHLTVAISKVVAGFVILYILNNPTKAFLLVKSVVEIFNSLGGGLSG